MNPSYRESMEKLHSGNRDLENTAFSELIAATSQPIEWAYEIWDEIETDLRHKEGHRRAIAAQILCNLSKSDPKDRMLKSFDRLLHVTRDEKFVTARHCMQSIWKVGLAGKKQQALLMNGLEKRFQECIKEKNCTLIRYDILQSMRNLYDQVKDEKIREKAEELIETEDDLKYQKKYKTVWRVKK